MALVGYHGTTSDEFDRFDPEFIGTATGTNIPGFYFASRRATAAAYLDQFPVIKPKYAEEFKRLKRPRGGGAEQLVREFDRHFGTKHPPGTDVDKLRMPDGGYPMPWEMAQLPSYPERKQIVRTWLNVMADQDRIRPQFWDLKRFGRVITAEIDLADPFVFDARGAAWTPQLDETIKAGMRELGGGFDGIIIKNVYDGEVGLQDDVYVVFDPGAIRIKAQRNPRRRSRRRQR